MGSHQILRSAKGMNIALKKKSRKKDVKWKFQKIVDVRTYVEHVMNICHIELANPLIKCTLLVIG